MKFNNRPAIQALREEIQRALSKPEFGLEVQRLFGNGNFVVEAGNSTYDPDGNDITFKLSFTAKDAVTGVMVNKEAIAFKTQAHLLQMKPDWLDQTFTWHRDKYRIVGLAVRSYKFPVICKKVSNGKGVKFPAETIIAAMAQVESRQPGQHDAVYRATDSPKRPDAEILKDLQGVENNLSPENLTCDGELSRTQVAQKSAALNARRRTLVAELGREPTDEELYPGIF